MVFGGNMAQISEDLKARITGLIPEDAELHAHLEGDNFNEVIKVIGGYYAMTDTVCRALQGASDEEKAKRPDLPKLIETSEKWGPRYEQLEEIFDELSAIKQ